MSKVYEIKSKNGFAMKGTFRQLATIVGKDEHVMLFEFLLGETHEFRSQLGITFAEVVENNEASEVWIVLAGASPTEFNDSIDSVHRSQESAAARFEAIHDFLSGDADYLSIVSAPWNP